MGVGPHLDAVNWWGRPIDSMVRPFVVGRSHWIKLRWDSLSSRWHGSNRSICRPVPPRRLLPAQHPPAMHSIAILYRSYPVPHSLIATHESNVSQFPTRAAPSLPPHPTTHDGHQRTTSHSSSPSHSPLRTTLRPLRAHRLVLPSHLLATPRSPSHDPPPHHRLQAPQRRVLHLSIRLYSQILSHGMVLVRPPPPTFVPRSY
jgi:hypothetical protein